MSPFVPRYVPDRPLPPYAFVPGDHPHPTRDPEGHSHGRAPEPLDTAFAWGVDLYNHGYFWEAHEAWEALWRAAPADDPRAELYQGLIQCAAACVKARSGDAEAARRVGERATRHLDRAIDARIDTHGLELCELTARFAEWIDGGPADVEDRPAIHLRDATGQGG